MAETKTFPLSAVLTFITGRLISRDDWDDMYDLARWMTGEPVSAVGLPRVSDECQPEILRQHPWLMSIRYPEGLKGEAEVTAWLAEQVEYYGPEVELSPLAPEDHTSIHPIAEFKMLRPDGEVIAVDFGGKP